MNYPDSSGANNTYMINLNKISMTKGLDQTIIPRHLGIIMDGNGHWAQQRGLLEQLDIKLGFKQSKDLLKPVPKLGLRY